MTTVSRMTVNQKLRDVLNGIEMGLRVVQLQFKISSVLVQMYRS